MKKRTISLAFLLLAVVLMLGACADEKQAAESALLTPLLRFSVEEGMQGETRVQYLPQSQGFFYVQPKENGGFTGGFVSPARSMSCENVIQGEGELSSMLIWERGKDEVYLLASDGIYLALLAKNNGGKTPLTGEVSVETAFSYEKDVFLTETESLILLTPTDMKGSYVLTEKESLPDYAALLATSDGGEKIYYAKGAAGAYTGFGFFEYGKTLPLGGESLAFTAFQRVGDSGVLFTCPDAEGKTTYDYRDFQKGESRSLTVEKAFDSVTVNASGTVLCGLESRTDGGEVTVYDLATGKKKGSYESTLGTLLPQMAISGEGDTLLLAIYEGQDQIFGTLDLERL